MKNVIAAREAMVKGQVIINGVYNVPIIEAMMELPREDFTPTAYKPVAYSSLEIPLSEGRFLVEPMIAARLLDSVDINEKSVILDLAAGFGYTTAICASIGRHVVSVENAPECVQALKNNIKKFDLKNVTVVEDSPEKGAPDLAPYDIIFINGSVAKAAPEIIDQLRVGGSLIAVVTQGVTGRATRFTKTATALNMSVLFECMASAIPEFALRRA